jgi:hypothetical protein
MFNLCEQHKNGVCADCTYDKDIGAVQCASHNLCKCSN